MIQRKLHVLFKFKPEIKDKLIYINAEHNLEYEINHYVISYPYSNENRLLVILKFLSNYLSASEQKSLLVSFDYTNSLYTLNNLTSLFALIQTKLKQEIIQLIRTGELYSVMQPIYDIQQKRLYGYEFLLRGLINGKEISPIEIFETAKEVGLQHLLDSRARDISIQTASQLKDKHLKIFINFLPSVINSEKYNLNQTFLKAIDFDVPLSRLVFELVETENMESFNDVNTKFQEYKNNGTTLAIDDVGAGYSSLNKLHQLSPNYVKIDRELISGCDTNFEKSRIMKSIVDLCDNLNIITLAEGIEREEELQTCINLGIKLGQGYLLGKPSKEPIQKSYFEKE